MQSPENNDNYCIKQYAEFQMLIDPDLDAKLNSVPVPDLLPLFEIGYCYDVTTTICEKFLNKGAPINATDSNGSSILMKAILRNLKDVVLLLITKKANLNIVNNNGDTALRYAVFCHSKEIIEKILETSGNKFLAEIDRAIDLAKKNRLDPLIIQQLEQKSIADKKA